MKVSLIHNPAAGNDAQISANKLIRLIRKAGHKVKYFSSKDKGWKKALKKPCDIIAVAGGDGTVGRIARSLVDSRTPIVVLPMGTANNIATTLGLAGRTVEDLVSGWNSARCVNFDIGMARGPWGLRHFIEGSSWRWIVCRDDVQD